MNILISDWSGELEQDGTKSKIGYMSGFEDAKLEVFEKVISMIICIVLESVEIVLDSGF